MSVKSKSQLTSDIAASTFKAPQQVILEDIVDSYEDIFPNITTVQRDAIATPTNGQIIYNTDNDRYEYWNGVAWFGIGQDLSTPLVVKIDLSSAQILAINSTPITIASAISAGYAFMLNSIAWRFTYGSIQYAGGGSGIAVHCSTKPASSAFMVVSAAVLTAAANRSGGTAVSSGSGGDVIVENDDIVLGATTAFTAGDGTLSVWVNYSIITY